MRRVSFLTAVLCLALFAGSVVAQCTAGSGVVDLALNGNVAAGQTLTLGAAPGGTTTVSLTDVSAAGGNAFILAGGSSIVCQTMFLPIGETIDIVAAQVILNGITPLSFFDSMAVTDFSFTYATDCAANGTSGPALQAVHLDAANPLGIGVTGAIQANYSNPAIITTTYENFGDDTAIFHSTAPLCPGAASVNMLYGGVPYQHIWIGSNGPVTFNAGNTSFSPSTTTAFGWSHPGVIGRWQDMARSTAMNDKVVVLEDPALGTCQVIYQDQEDWDTGTPLGTFVVTFGYYGPGTIDIDHTASLLGAAGNSCVMGVVDGDGAAGADTLLDFSSILTANGGTGSYNTPAGSAPDSVLEGFAGGAIDQTYYAFFDNGVFDWSIF